MNGPVEPAAALRAMARMYYETFVALTAEGFTEPQALQLIAVMHVAAVNREDGAE